MAAGKASAKQSSATEAPRQVAAGKAAKNAAAKQVPATKMAPAKKKAPASPTGAIRKRAAKTAARRREKATGPWAASAAGV